MGDSYELKNIKLNAPSQTGHITYPKALYRSRTKIIVKENKHGNSQFSQLEIAFSNLARLFLTPEATPEQHLVVDNSKQIFGVAVEHLCYVIANKEGFDASFYTISKDLAPVQPQPKVIHPDQIDEIPLYFLNELPHEFFAQLLNAEKEDRIAIDFASLANIFTGPYTLEEDDLHKGNFGFYFVEKNNKPTAVFFKIDHDLMFVDSIMSFCSTRFFHWHQGAKAFEITQKDLLAFPRLIDSANSYWPTKRSNVPIFFKDKAFHTKPEVESFASLAQIPKFNDAKWYYFYKHILMPTALITKALTQSLDHEKAEDRAQIALITQAVVARQARLRAVLFSIKEFRDFVINMDEDKAHKLSNEVVATGPDYNDFVVKSMSNYKELCEKEFDEGDTPLHVSIKLGDYRHQETLQSFDEFINTKNNAGKTPLDVAVGMVKDQKATDIRQDARSTIKHLVQNGADKSEANKIFIKKNRIKKHRFENNYLKRVRLTKRYEELKEILRDLGEDTSFSLKCKKNLAIECTAYFIQTNKDNLGLKDYITALQNDVNNESPELKYIRQLRSSLWIVRQIRGMYGRTTTQDAINDIIDDRLERIQNENACCYTSYSYQ